MWQRFTERARRVVFFAQEEANRWQDEAVGTEHLLLGLIREDDSVAARIIGRLGVPLADIREEVEKRLTRGDGRPMRDMELTPRSRRSIDLAYDEACQFQHNYIGTEHLLLGLIREGEGLAAKVLANLKIELKAAREEIRKITAQALNKQEEKTTSGATSFDTSTPEANSDLEPVKGDLGTLYNPEGRGGAEWVEAALTEEALPLLTEVMILRDEYGYRELFAGGTVLRVPAGTEAKLLRKAEQNQSHYAIRILSGEHAGAVVWIEHDQFRHTGRDTRPFPPPLEENKSTS